MKNNKQFESFGEFNENLNKSDVSDSEITKGFKFKMNGEDWIDDIITTVRYQFKKL